MRQRATIAMALVTNPELVVLDEPSSALDLLTQANLMNVLKKIKHEYGTTFILITRHWHSQRLAMRSRSDVRWRNGGAVQCKNTSIQMQGIHTHQAHGKRARCRRTRSSSSFLVSPLPSSTHPQDAGLQTDVNSALGSAVSIRL